MDQTSQTAETAAPEQSARAAVVDCDVHHVILSHQQFATYLDAFWGAHLEAQQFPDRKRVVY